MPDFVQLPTNYAEEYARALANAYPYKMYFGEVYTTPNNTLYKPLNGKTIHVPSMTTSGAKFVDRDNLDGTFKRNHNSQYQALDMSMYREWDNLIDPADINQTNMVYTIANATKTFNEFQKLPEMDSYAASKIGNMAQLIGNADATVLTAENVLAQWDSYHAFLTEKRVPLEGRIAYVTPNTYKLLKQAAGITRFVSVASAGSINRHIADLDGVTVKQVPSDLMKTAFTYTQGWQPAEGAKQINMLIVHPLSVVAPIVYETSLLTPPAANTKGKWLYYEAFYYDVFTLDQRLAGIYANITNPTLGALEVTSVAGSESGKSTITVSPASIPGTKYVYAIGATAQTPTYGQTVTGFTDLGAGIDITATAGQVITIVAVNRDTGVAAASGNTTVIA